MLSVWPATWKVRADEAGVVADDLGDLEQDVLALLLQRLAAGVEEHVAGSWITMRLLRTSP